MYLIKEYDFVSRNDLVSAAERLADFIEGYISKGQEVPIINIIGSPGGGKSIFWDIVTSKLLQKGGIFCSDQSEKTQRGERLYETWTSLDKENPLRVFLCNVRASDQNAINLDLDDLQNNFRKFGDVIILSNAHQKFISDDIPQLQINLLTIGNDTNNKFTGQLEYTCNL